MMVNSNYDMSVMRTPRSLNIDITSKCNLHCPFCAHFTSSGDVDDDLPLQEWLTFFEECKKCAVLNLLLGGGEPFFRSDLPAIIEGIVRNQMRFSILSNGTLLTEKMASFLASTRRCSHVQISVDGASAATHEAIRGKGNFPKALHAIALLQKYNIGIQIRVTINRRNVYELDAIAKLLLEDLKLKTFSTNSADYEGLCRQNAQAMQLTVTERSYAMKELLRLNRKYNNRITASSGPLADATSWPTILELRRKGGKGTGGRLMSCGAVLNKMAVRADGIMVPCCQLNHMELGRINKNSLEDIWQHHPGFTHIRMRSNIALSSFSFCHNCDFIEYCKGGCPAIAYNYTGEENTPVPELCLRQFLSEGGVVPEKPA
jgi:SynChlorMet cassette radical SAM/SPASM protein ScmE